METIAQISTPLGNGGVAIIRMSGENALNTALNFFHSKNLNKENIKSRYMYLGEFETDVYNEQCLMVYFKNPFSFTGEDVVEFQIHGGEYLASKILQTLLDGGIRLAENGEFTKRAFLNGKITLNNAESMIDLINATSNAELCASSKLAGGNLAKTIKKLQEDIKQLLVSIAVNIDYPEYDEEQVEMEKVELFLKQSKDVVQKLIESYNQGSLIQSGVSVAIVGKPNVGKSSILNALIGEDVAIVTDIQGTTRDIIKETIVFKNIKINFIDTAGIRESDDVVESIGIQKSKDMINNSNIVICVLDASNKLEQQDEEILGLCKDKNTIYVLNKCDRGIVTNIDGAIKVCATENKNIEQIKNEILNQTKTNNIDFNQLVITNKRHYEVLNTAKNKIQEIQNQTQCVGLDIVESQLKRLWQILGKITGESEVENIVDEIFKKFCLGK